MLIINYSSKTTLSIHIYGAVFIEVEYKYNMHVCVKALPQAIYNTVENYRSLQSNKPTFKLIIQCLKLLFSLRLCCTIQRYYKIGLPAARVDLAQNIKHTKIFFLLETPSNRCLQSTSVALSVLKTFHKVAIVARYGWLNIVSAYFMLFRIRKTQSHLLTCWSSLVILCYWLHQLSSASVVQW